MSVASRLFDIRSGHRTEPPALNDVPHYTVQIDGGQVVLTLPQDNETEPQGSTQDADPRQFVIVGGGAAGNAAAEELRREGYHGKIAVVSSVSSLPVDRPNVSKDYLAGHADPAWMPLRGDEAWYAARDIELKLGTTVARNRDPKAHTVHQTLFLWLFNACGFWVAFKAFGIELPFTAALLLQSVIALFVSVPSGPGFWGLYEGAARIVVVSAYGIPLDKATGFAIGFHLGGFIPVTVIGLYYAWRLGISLREVEVSEEVVESAVEDALPPDHNKP